MNRNAPLLTGRPAGSRVTTKNEYALLIPHFELNRSSGDAGTRPSVSATTSCHQIVALGDRQARGVTRVRVVAMRCRRQMYKAVHFDVVSIRAKAAPDGLDQRAGGHRERIAEGISSHTSAPLPLDRLCTGVRGRSVSVSPPRWIPKNKNAEGE